MEIKELMDSAAKFLDEHPLINEVELSSKDIRIRIIRIPQIINCYNSAPYIYPYQLHYGSP